VVTVFDISLAEVTFSMDTRISAFRISMISEFLRVRQTLISEF
jgi:hypothetical protein